MTVGSNLLESFQKAANKVVATAADRKLCPEGEHWDDFLEGCVADTTPSITASATAAPVSSGFQPSPAPSPTTNVAQNQYNTGIQPSLLSQAAERTRAPVAGARAAIQPVTSQEGAQRRADAALRGLGGFGNTVRTGLKAADTVGDVPLSAIPGGGNVLGSALEAGGKEPTVGGGVQFALDEEGNPVSRFIGREIRPRAADVGEAIGTAAGFTPTGAALNAAGSTIGVDTGDVGRAVGEYGTPVSPLDLALSVAVPATADWADAYRLAKGAGLLDDVGRILPNVTRGQIDNVLRRAGKTYDELVSTARVGPFGTMEGPDFVGQARKLDEAAQAGAGRAPPPGSAAGSGSSPAAAADLPASAGGAGDLPPQSDPLTRLTDRVNTARPLPELTEAERKAERARRVAILASQQERGGFTDEAFQQGKAALSGELPVTRFEPLGNDFAPEEIQQFRNMIGESSLRPLERMNANDALNKVLEGNLNEVRRFEIDLLDRVYGSDFALSVAKQAAPPRLRDKFYEFWLSSILSGPMTQARNIVGNTVAAISAPVERLGGALLEAPIARIQGRPVERFIQEAPEQVFGMAQGFPEGVSGALRAWKTGIGQAALTESASRAPAIGGLTGRVIRAPMTALEAMDAFFGAINFRGAMHALAVRTARQEGLTGHALRLRINDLLANPTDDLIDAATNERLYRLFRDDPTRFGKALGDFRQSAPGVRWLLPFLRTPDRLLAYGIRRSPLGLLDYSMWQKLVKGNPDAVDDLARTLMGSSIAAGLGGLVATGQLDITGAVPSKASERDRFFREGKLPFSVKLPGVGWVQYNQIPGMDTTLSTLAAAADSFREGGSPDKFIGELAGNIGQSVFDKSYLTGISDFMEIFSGGYSDPADTALRWASRQASGVVPFSALGRQTSQFFDQTVYKPEGFLENVAAGVGVGGQAGVMPRLNAFGEVADRPFPSPVSVSGDTQLPVDKALEGSGIELGFVGDSISGTELDQQGQYNYQRAAGRAAYDVLYDTIHDTRWRYLSDTQKATLLEDAIGAARKSVRDQFNAELKRVSDRFELMTPDQQVQVINEILKRLGDRESRGDDQSVFRKPTGKIAP